MVDCQVSDYPTLQELVDKSFQIKKSSSKLEADDTEPVPHGTIYAVHLDYSFQYVDQS